MRFFSLRGEEFPVKLFPWNVAFFLYSCVFVGYLWESHHFLTKKKQRLPSRFGPKERRRIDAILVAAFAISSIQPEEGHAVWELVRLAVTPKTWRGDLYVFFGLKRPGKTLEMPAILKILLGRALNIKNIYIYIY